MQVDYVLFVQSVLLVSCLEKAGGPHLAQVQFFQSEGVLMNQTQSCKSGPKSEPRPQLSFFSHCSSSGGPRYLLLALDYGGCSCSGLYIFIRLSIASFIFMIMMVFSVLFRFHENSYFGYFRCYMSKKQTEYFM